MKTPFAIALHLLACAMLAIGCYPRDPLEKIVFIEDGEFKVTAAETRDAVLLTKAINAFAGKPFKEKKFVKWANSTAFRIIPGILANRLLKEEFDAKGIKATPESDRKILDAHNRFMRRKAKSKEELAKAFGALEAFYLRQFDFESRKAVFLESIEKTAVPTDEQVEKQFARNREKRAKEDEVQKKAVAKAQEAWDRLNSGESWEAVAKKYNEDPLLSDDYKDYWKMWESIPRTGSFIPEDVAAFARSMKAGEFTKPIETDDGLLIVKVLKIDEDSIDCARINIRLPYFTEVPDKPQLKKQMQAEAVKERMQELISELHGKHTFDYPMGTNITYEIFK